MTRNAILALSTAAIAVLAFAGWATATALHSQRAVASEGRGLEVRYEVRRAVAYVPPPPVEATRLDVLNPGPPTTIEDGVLSAQAGQALRGLEAEDGARTAAALAAIRAEDARIDRDTAAALSSERQDAGEKATAQPTSVS